MPETAGGGKAAEEHLMFASQGSPGTGPVGLAETQVTSSRL